MTFVSALLPDSPLLLLLLLDIVIERPCALFDMEQIFVFADNGNFAIPGVTEDPDGEFIPDCTRCERLRLVGCRRSKPCAKCDLILVFPNDPCFLAINFPLTSSYHHHC
jgi:hypothetical protein